MRYSRLWIGLLILILLAPIGLVLPAYFEAPTAWGEWSVGEIKTLVGFIPYGLTKLSPLWNAPLPDYAVQGWENRGIGAQSIVYILSALLGMVVTVLLVFGLGKWLARKND